jgi:hypothetical protein
MPKENINDTVTDGFRAEVGWSHGCVQVATTNAASTFELPADSDAASSSQPDRPSTGTERFLAAVTGMGTPEPFHGWFVTLDRDGCNRMIRALRKARDAAYGRDE